MEPLVLWPLTFAGLGLFWLTDFPRQRGLLSKRVAKLKALGCPLTPEEFDAFMAVPDAENAAPVYQRLREEIDTLKEQHPGALDEILKTELENLKLSRSLRDCVECLRPIIVLLEEASAFPSHRAPLLADPHMVDHIGPTVKIAAKVLSADIVIEASDGHWESVKRKTGLLRTVLDHSFYRPTVLSWLISISQAVRYMRTLNALVRLGYEQRGFLDWIEECVEDIPKPLPLLPCMKGEVASGIAYGEILKRTDFKEIFPGKVPTPLSWPYFQSEAAIDAYISRGLDGLIHSLSLWPADESDWMQVAIAYQPRRHYSWRITPSTAWDFGSHDNAVNAVTAQATWLRLARTGLWLHRQKLATGSFPPDLSPLKESAQSPVNQAPFAYQTDGTGFELKSGTMKY